MNKTLGRFGRLRQTLLEDEKVLIPQPNKTKEDPLSRRKDTPSEPSEPIEQLELIHEWMRICTMDGHIEPAQPDEGKCVGWPVRPFSRNSLFVDLELRCRKDGIPGNRQPSMNGFYRVADQIFDREGDKYHFPPLNICRERFEQYLKDWQAGKTH